MIEKPIKKRGDYSLIKSSKVINYPCNMLYNELLSLKDRKRWEKHYERGMIIEQISGMIIFALMMNSDLQRCLLAMHRIESNHESPALLMHQ